MHSRVFAEKNANAQTRMINAANALVDKLALDPALVDALTPSGRMPADVRSVAQRDAVAAILEAALERLTPQQPEAVVPEDDTPTVQPGPAKRSKAK